MVFLQNPFSVLNFTKPNQTNLNLRPDRHAARIAIVEDNPIAARVIKKIAEQLGYITLGPAVSFETATELIREGRPDLLLMDIQLAGEKDGIELARYVEEHFKLPIVFLTSNADLKTINRIKQEGFVHLLTKPVNKAELNGCIEIALHQHRKNGLKNQRKSTVSEEINIFNQAIFIKDMSALHKVKFDDVLYLESDHIYVNIVTTQRKFTVRSSMTAYLEHFDQGMFIRVHRSYVININRIERIDVGHVLIGSQLLPVAKTYRESLLNYLHIG